MFRNFYTGYIVFTAILLLCMAGITVILLDGEANLEKSDSWIFRTHESIIEAERLNTLIARSVSSQRGYLITGDQRFLDEYNERKSAVRRHLTRMRQLTKGNGAQQARIDVLEEYADLLTNQLEVRAALYNASSPSNRLADVEMVKDLKNTIFRTSEAFLEEEYNLLNRRIQTLERRKNEYYRTLLVGGSLSIVLLMIFNGFLLRARTRRSAAERALRERETVFRLAVEGANDGVFDWDLRRDKAFFSNQLTQMLGYTSAQLGSSYRAIMDRIHPDEQGEAREYLELYLSGQLSEYSTTYRMQHRAGDWVWVQVRAQALFDSNGKAVRLVGAHTDVSASKLFELNLQEAKKKAEAANEAKSDFLAHMSHEIRTPLTTISGVADILENDSEKLEPRQQQLVGVLKSSAISLRDLVTDVLDFSKIESGQLSLEHREFSLREVIQQIISVTSPGALEKGLEFSVDYDELEQDRVIGDAIRLRQILLNLTSNAIKFTAKGSVAIKAWNTHINDNLVLNISVTDTGVGIPRNKLDTIFERFKQADASISRRFGGTGLGLSISIHLANLMGGNIEVTSSKGKGSTFTLVIPLPSATTRGDSGAEKSAEEDAKLADQLKAAITDERKVLLVEDYEGNIVVLSHLLETMGCLYDVARTGLEAITLWRANHYDAVLMDIQMPEMDGYKATAHIRQLEEELKLERTPIIGMTAHALAGDRERCFNSGMDDYLPKPIVEQDLRATLSRHLTP